MTGGTYRRIQGAGRCQASGIPYIDGWQDDPPVVESEPAFLDRQDLWIQGERERVSPSAFAEQLFSYELTVAPRGAPGFNERDDTGGTE